MMDSKRCFLVLFVVCVATIGVFQYLMTIPPTLKEGVSESNRDDDNFEDVLKPQSHDFLALINSFRDFHRSHISQYVKNRMADVFRKGYGRTPIKTEDGEKGWIENGVLFRPIRKDLALMKNYKDVEHEHQSDMEYYVPFNKTLFYQGKKVPSDTSIQPKIILWYHKAPYTREMPSLEKLWLCPEFPCQITTNKSYSSKSTAWIMDGKGFTRYPPKGRQEQVTIFHALNHFSRKLGPSWYDWFNWTLTYRSDSDIQFTFGVIRKRQEPLVKDYARLIAQKTSVAVAFISHCKTKNMRMEYINELKKYISVDIFGKCGNNACSQLNHTICSNIINTKYKFFLAFENSMCEDNISEKLFRYMSIDVILVTRGGDGYYRHLPPEIYISTADFESPRQLANLLIHLDKSPVEYEAILREKNKYVSAYEDWLVLSRTHDVGRVFNLFEAIPLCRICHWLWNLEDHTKTIHNLTSWLGKKEKCITRKDI